MDTENKSSELLYRAFNHLEDAFHNFNLYIYTSNFHKSKVEDDIMARLDKLVGDMLDYIESKEDEHGK